MPQLVSVVALVVVLAGAGVLFVRRVSGRMAVLRAGRPVDRTDDLGTRATRELVQVLGQRKLFQKALPGLMHALIFWGFLVLLPTIIEAALASVDAEWTLPFLGEAPWFLTLIDVFATLVAVGVGIAFYIRKVQKPARFEGSHEREASLILWTIWGIVGSRLLWNATRIAPGLTGHPTSMPVSNALSNLFADDDVTEVLERVFVWMHLLLILGFLT